ncbi:MAG TPA: universal stress protein [Caldilineaceae bacterium]|nr:universal stress protein [Caldilineaceae bacterium]
MAIPMRLLIGYDGSPYGDAALDDLRRAGLPQAVEAIVLSVADVLLPPAGDEPPPSQWAKQLMEEANREASRLLEEAHAIAQRGCQRLQAYFPEWQVHAQACADSPAWGIILKAEEWQADLVVVGSHSRSALGRLFLGSVSQMVVNQAHCSVRVARAREVAPDQPLRLLIGVDGSAQAEVAVRAVAARRWPPRTEVRLMAAVDPRLLTTLAAASRMDPTGSGDGRAQVGRMIEATGELVRQGAPQVTVSTVIKDGDPKQLLLAEAEQWGADCIFVGPRGHGQRERLWLGSVSTAIAAQARCSVEVVRAKPE